MKMDWQGYGLYFAIVEMLSSEEHIYKLPTDYDCIAFALQAQSDTIKVIVENFKLFTVDGGYFWSESLLRRMQIKDEKSKKASQSAEKRWQNQRLNANALPPHSDRNAIKVNKSKVNKSKSNKENKENKSTVCVEHVKELYNLYPKKVGRKKAMVAIEKALKITNIDTIKEGLLKYIDATKNTEPRYIKHPATWFNGECWDDEPESQSQGVNIGAIELD